MFPINDALVATIKEILKEDAQEEIQEMRMFQKVTMQSSKNEIAFYFNPRKIVIQRVEIHQKRRGTFKRIIREMEKSKWFDKIVIESALTEDSIVFCEKNGFKRCTRNEYNFYKIVES